MHWCSRKSIVLDSINKEELLAEEILSGEDKRNFTNSQHKRAGSQWK